MTERLSYAIVTPARNEAENLVRLAACLELQTLPPAAWVVVDSGSTDDTAAVAAALAGRLPWAAAASAPGEAEAVRGGPIVRAFTAGLEALPGPPEVVVKLDADISFGPDFFAGLTAAFAEDSRLGLTSGVCHEHDGRTWRPLHGTRDHVQGACRAYRWACLQDVLPLEERQGWDELDAIKARAAGWSVRTTSTLPFRHHRREGERDPSRRAVWSAQGDTAYYMGYRLPYLVLRTAFRIVRDRHAYALLTGYLSAWIDRRPRCPDPGVRTFIRREQSLRRIPLRIRESLGRPA